MCILTNQLYRWLKSFGITIASERQMRLEVTLLVGEAINAEKVPMVFPCKEEKGEEIKMATMAYIRDLWEALENNLDKCEDETRRYIFTCTLYTYTSSQHHFSISRLTWHEGAIPEDEIWVKIGEAPSKLIFKWSTL